MKKKRFLAAILPAALLLATALPAGAGESRADPAGAFWQALQSLCGQAFAGRVVENLPPDPSFDSQQLVMHVRECSETTIRIPFHVGDNRSRTWVFTRTATGIRLKHDHRHEDGTPDRVTNYGGDTATSGTAKKQEFPADQHTAELLPAAAANVWTVEIEAGKLFAYSLRREGRRFRAELDLSAPVPPPAPPWGS